MDRNYIPVLFLLVVAVVTAVAIIGLSQLVMRSRPTPVKQQPYESGMPPLGDARERFSVKFYMVAMLFIVFDIEAVFLYPWVVVFRELKWLAFSEMFLFVAFILAGFFYVWKKGVLDWAKTPEPQRQGRRNLPPNFTLTDAPPAPKKPEGELVGAGD